MTIPVHPMLVHFPIAFYFLELILLCGWAKRRDENYLNFARFTFRLGYLFMILAIVMGFLDAGGIPGIQGRVRTHFFSAASVFVLYTIRAFFWRFGNVQDPSYQKTQLLFALTGNILVVMTGYFGGLLVYGST